MTSRAMKCLYMDCFPGSTLQGDDLGNSVALLGFFSFFLFEIGILSFTSLVECIDRVMKICYLLLCLIAEKCDWASEVETSWHLQIMKIHSIA